MVKFLNKHLFFSIQHFSLNPADLKLTYAGSWGNQLFTKELSLNDISFV